MADLIALLLSAITGLLGTGAGADELSKRIALDVMESQPVPIATAKVDCLEVSDNGVKVLEFQLHDLLLDPLEIDFAQINVKQVSLTGRDRITFKGLDWQTNITDDALTSALSSQVARLKDATVLASKNGIELTGTYPVWRMRVPYKVSGSLAIENDTQLMFRIDKTGVSGINLPRALSNMIEAEINPVYDLADFAARSKKDLDLAKEQLDYIFKLRILSISSADGHIIVKGDA